MVICWLAINFKLQIYTAAAVVQSAGPAIQPALSGDPRVAWVDLDDVAFGFAASAASSVGTWAVEIRIKETF